MEDEEINLLIASYIFYAAWNPPFVILLLRVASLCAYDAQHVARRRSLTVEVPVVNPISQEELVRMAMRLRNDLFDYEDKLGSCRDFSELKKSADALVVAILEPLEFRLSTCSSKKTARVYQFPAKKSSVPRTLD